MLKISYVDDLPGPSPISRGFIKVFNRRGTGFNTRAKSREEKLLHHIAMLAKFLDDNKPKRHLKSGFALFQTSSTLLVSFNLSNVAKIVWVKSERTVCKFKKRKTKFLFCSHLLHKSDA